MKPLRRYPTVGQLLLLLLASWLAWRWISAPVPSPGLPAEGWSGRVVRVIDGDTLLIEGGYRVRLLGVDTPETKHPQRPAEPWGSEASDFTRARVEGQQVQLEFDRARHDDYGRWLAYVWIDGVLLNEELIAQGFSRAETGFPFRSDRQRQFRKAEEQARREERGIWSASSTALSKQPATSANSGPQ